MNTYIFPEQEYLSRNLKRYRKQKRLTQAALACRVGYHRTYISALESGRINPTLATLVNISRELGVDVVYLLIDTRRMG